MEKYYYENGDFIIESYDKAKTFSSFLPGIAGLKGIPIWAFYVNRGQGIASFGIQGKNNPILEFSPANISYQNVSRNGFRTFIKINDHVIEAFDTLNQDELIIRKMLINEAKVTFSERNERDGYEIKVVYFGIPNENFAGLTRKVEIKNISNNELNLEVIDGLTSILPYGIDNAGYKAVGNLLRSWMEVFNLNSKIAFYKIRASTSDSSEINEVKKGNFYLSFSNEEVLITPIVDCSLIFDYDTSLGRPVNFINNSLKDIQDQKQVTANKVPCGFTGISKKLAKEEIVRINTIIGQSQNFDYINEQKSRLVNNEYIDKKEKEAYLIIRNLTDDINLSSSNHLFDEYSRQCYLDNFIRGGYPYIIKNKDKGFVYHLYSRKHGDLERDYNQFSLIPEYYSQGNGNFRDVNQNRRNDVLFNPKVGIYNIKTFMSLIQLDGYNPLSVNGTTFYLKSGISVSDLVKKCFLTHQKELEIILTDSFTPGKIINYIYNNNVTLNINEEEMIEEIFSVSYRNIEANFGEGYWIDHWTYNMDLIDSYIQIFPDKFIELLFEDNTYQYFDSPVFVYPRDEKYVMSKQGKIRQYGTMMYEDKEKIERLGISLYQTNWLKTNYGKGQIYKTNLFVKLFSLALIKFTTLDPSGIGIEMEADKPGWNDAMNGLPGLFGSGISETFELLRVIEFLEKVTQNYEIKIPVEIIELMDKVNQYLDNYFNNKFTQFEYWDKTSEERELFREKTRFGINGREVTVLSTKIKLFIKNIKAKIMIGLNSAKTLGNGIYPTYLIHEPIEFEVVKDKLNNVELNHLGLPKVCIRKFEMRVLPYFIEAPAKSMKVINDKQSNRKLHQLIQKTDIFDKKLLMYKTSESLENESFEIGRARAFTPGWLERESIFLHMTYKYLLGLLKGGLYDEYFEAMKTNVIPFLNPEIYGRSTLENSSFIASSINPNEKLHGQGFQARLSGSNSEFLSMWTYMMYGKEPFVLCNNQLIAQFKPIIPNWLFDKNNELQFTFLGKTSVTYINPLRLDTYNENCVVKNIIISINNEEVIFNQSYLPEEYALLLREGRISNIQINIGIN